MNDIIEILDDLEAEEEQMTGVCSSCSSELEPIYENNGYTQPNGPSHYEVVGYKPCLDCHYNDYCDWENDEALQEAGIRP
jgi:hypothetical protein